VENQDRNEDNVARTRADAVLRAISEQSPDGIVVQEKGVITFVSPAMAKMFRYEERELIGKPAELLATVDTRATVLRATASRQPLTFFARGLRKDGSSFRAQVHARWVPFEGGSVHVGVIRDFTEQDEAESARAESVSLLRATLDSTADGILLVDLNGHIVLHNERFLKIWRMPPSVIEKVDEATTLRHAEQQLVDPVRFRARLGELAKKPAEQSTDVLEFVDGRIIERYSRPQYVGASIMGRVWSFRDVSAQRRAERALELAVQMRDEFIGIASHELFTPITSLTVALRGLRASSASSAETTTGRLLGAAERQVERLARLVRELLDVGRIDGGILAITREDLDLCEVARDTLERFSAELERDGIEVRLLAPEPVVGRWDRVRLEQVATNLLSNAIKFGRGRPIEVAVRFVDGCAHLAVRDEGIGIPHDRQTLIFERFQRAVSARHYAGLGLGLYITRQLVEAHGGKLRVDSTPGVGATFTVELPSTVPV
jgi:PAS domain S-box-containing protein